MGTLGLFTTARVPTTGFSAEEGRRKRLPTGAAWVVDDVESDGRPACATVGVTGWALGGVDMGESAVDERVARVAWG